MQTRIDEHPDWRRHRVTQDICQQGGWRTHTGQLKKFAARRFIDKRTANPSADSHQQSAAYAPRLPSSNTPLMPYLLTARLPILRLYRLS
ncbi:MAG: hypothetical protein R8K48_03150 [Gallionella sp.]